MMYQCLAVDFDKVDKQIKSIIKKLDMYGFNYNYKVHNVELKMVPCYKVNPANKTQKYKECDTLVEVQNYEFDMETLKLGNYIPVAVIEHNVVLDNDGINNIVHMVNKDEPIQKKWLTIEGHCDDCHDNYNRIKTIILKDINNGEYKQVGTGCLRKYIGIDCLDIISIYGSVDEIFNKELCLEDKDYRHYANKYCTTQKFLAACIDVIKSDKEYRSKQFAQDSTVEQAKRKIISNENIQSYNDAEEIINFYKNLIVSDVCEKFCVGFDLDICNACISEYTRIDNGRLAYAYVAYKKMKKVIDGYNSREENKLNSQFIGVVGDKITVLATLDKIIPINTMYGLSHLYIFTTEDCNELTWLTSSSVNIDIDKKYNITGKVKEHKFYDNKKQTVLTRVKIDK